MSERSRQLQRLLEEEIRRQGMISFERFMERALYEPGLGYYTAAGGARGPGVDFRTSPGVGGIFARLLAVQVEECWRRLGAPQNLVVAEFGAGSLALAASLRQALERSGAWPSSARYLAIEPHATPGTSSPGVERVNQAEALRALRASPGIVLSNEFLDALPVRRFVIRSGRPQEICVGLGSPSPGDPTSAPIFVDLEREITGEGETRAALQGLSSLPEGFQFELNLPARRWIEAVGGALSRGYVITFDYGYRRAERFRPEHASGTILAYHRHRAERDLYARPGQQDLTSHIDFDDLIEAGAAVGLETIGLCDQMRFLTALARSSGTLEGEPDSPESWRDRLAFKELIRPGGMGTTFRVLVQAKGASGGALTGLVDPFARRPA